MVIKSKISMWGNAKTFECVKFHKKLISNFDAATCTFLFLHRHIFVLLWMSTVWTSTLWLDDSGHHYDGESKWSAGTE